MYHMKHHKILKFESNNIKILQRVLIFYLDLKQDNILMD